MFGSTVLEVAIGLVFCFASVALISSSIYEAGASALKVRATSLLNGVKALLNDEQFSGLARDIYNSALVNPMHSGLTKQGARPPVIPSYIDPKHFALALVDAIQGAPASFAELGLKIDALPDGQIKRLLAGMYTRAGGKLENLQAELAEWFDASMMRVSGTYKRRSQFFIFFIAFIIAVSFNVDALHLVQTLWAHPALVAQVSMPNSLGVEQALKGLTALPVGWTEPPPSIPLALLGWLATACSVLFGAPFWFDLLQRLVNIRGTGQRPEHATKESAASGLATLREKQDADWREAALARPN